MSWAISPLLGISNQPGKRWLSQILHEILDEYEKKTIPIISLEGMPRLLRERSLLNKRGIDH